MINLSKVGLLALALILVAATPAFAQHNGFGDVENNNGAESAAAPHEGDQHGNATPIPIDPDLAIVTGLVFLVLLAVLWKFAWGPIIDGLAKREKSVADCIAATQRSAEEAERQLSEYNAKLAGAANEVRQLLDQARRDADAHKQEILALAQQAAQDERHRAIREIAAAKNVALSQLAQSSVDAAFRLAEHVVRRSLNTEDHARLIKETLDQFPSQN